MFICVLIIGNDKLYYMMWLQILLSYFVIVILHFLSPSYTIDRFLHLKFIYITTL